MEQIGIEISNYLELFARVNNSVGDQDVALAIMHELAKDRRMAMIRQSESAKNGNRNGHAANGQGNGNGNGIGDASATPRQRAFLEARGISTLGLSKAAASERIDALKSQEAR